jgi:hypothetical protein
MKTTDRFRVVAIIFCLSLVALTFLPNAKAEAWNRKTTVTFNEPVEVPGVGLHLLPAGTYVFKILSPLPYRHIVEITNVAEDHVFTTILAIPNVRARSTGKTVMTFRERAAGQPEAIRTWFYPGYEWGEEFVYPKSRAIELAHWKRCPSRNLRQRRSWLLNLRAKRFKWLRPWKLRQR